MICHGLMKIPENQDLNFRQPLAMPKAPDKKNVFLGMTYQSISQSGREKRQMTLHSLIQFDVELETFSKAYSNDNDKYSSSTMDSFEQKEMLFLRHCDHADIIRDDRHRASSISIIGNECEYYFSSLKHKKNLDITSLELTMKTRFLTPEHTCALLREQELLNLNSVMITNSFKSLSECLEILIKKLCDIQTSLPNEHRNENYCRKR